MTQHPRVHHDLHVVLRTRPANPIMFIKRGLNSLIFWIRDAHTPKAVTYHEPTEM